MRAVAAVYWLALCGWLCAAVAAGVAAMGIFSTLPDSGIELPAYRAYLGSDPAAHGRLAGGMVMERIFAGTDVAQTMCAFTLLVCLGIQWWNGSVGPRWAHRLRLACIVGAAALMAWHTLLLAPPMNRSLRAYWTAAKANQADEARRHQAEFQALHPRSDRLYAIRIGLLFATVPASAFALTATTPAAQKATRRGAA
jgi:hypothetical protein